MPDLFVCGTLRHLPLLEIVLGRSPETRPARLADAGLRAAGTRWGQPGLAQLPGASVEGLLLPGLSAEDHARLGYYTGWEDAALVPLSVTTDAGAVEAVGPAAVDQGGAPWEFDTWLAEWSALTLGTAEQIMAAYGQMPLEELDRLRSFIAARAWARLLGQKSAPATLRHDNGPDEVEIVRYLPGHEGFFRLRRYLVRHRRFDGTESETLQREGFVTYDAALVLPYDPVSDKVLLIEQMRYGPLMRGDPKPWVLEPAAGLVDAGESPEDCVLREAREEAGLAITALRPMVQVYASPGYTSEFFHCFLGLCDLSSRGTGLGGLESEHEDIRSHVIPFEQAMALVDSGEVNAGPLVMMIYWLARHREELRANA